jgi:acyl-CoA synthetase (NDP forming)
VTILPRDPQAVGTAILAMEEKFRHNDVLGYLLEEHVPYDPSLGGELLLGARWTDDFGPVVTCGAGGIHTEFLAGAFKPGSEIAVASPFDLDAGSVVELLQEVAVAGLLTAEQRGQPPRLELGRLVDLFMKFARLAREAVPAIVSEIEVNPFVIAGKRMLPLDVLVKCEPVSEPQLHPRPLEKIKNLLEPSSIAIIGVSERMKPGRVILKNLIDGGFDRRRIYVVKPDSETVEGCRCYPDVRSLPERVDLLVLAVGAAQLPDLLATVVEDEKAESIIVIPGGLEEREGTEDIVSRMSTIIESSRRSEWGGPVLNGGNSMGIRSQPGGYDATFIPAYKLSPPNGSHPFAFISQSGAFYVAKGGKLGADVRYAISIGNQMDLTIGDYLTYLKDDPELEVFAIYAEGFRPRDGLKFLEAAREISAEGRTVVLYRAGRTEAGISASASHTAAVAGDYVVNRELARQAGVIICETTADFEDLTRLFALLSSKEVRGLRLGPISNAGFECVSIADHLGRFQLADFSQDTRAGLLSVLQGCRLDEVVSVRVPLDVTPIMPDAPFAEAVRLVIEDENVDVGLVGCVPLTPALQTLAPGDAHAEDVYSPDSVAMRLVRLNDETKKAWVAVVDGGPLYDPMARMLEESGIPAFRTADRALRLFGTYCAARLRR